ncbi:MAG: M20/M25/M40 family metallo-hydrolase [Bacteroidales bacterium]
MKKSNLILILFLLFTGISKSQLLQVNNPKLNDFEGIYKFLASDWLEGREASEKGSFIAADYIASLMQTFDLLPFGDKNSYFQEFNLVKYKIDNSEFSIVEGSKESNSRLILTQNIDYELISGASSSEVSAPVVFAGYGLSLDDKSYDDYRNLQVKGKIVLVLSGFPGESDSLSAGWKKMAGIFSDIDILEETKIKNATDHGALAIIMMDSNEKLNPVLNNQVNLELAGKSMNSNKFSDEIYKDSYFEFPSQIKNSEIPCFKMSVSAGKYFIDNLGLNRVDFEKKASQMSASLPVQKELRAEFSIHVQKESVIVKNVIGKIEGKNPAKTIIVGAHYDHLGVRGNNIYNGADDNASGTAGMLALAKNWASVGQKPEYNLIFAAWTAEEEGHFGSRYFAESYKSYLKNVQLYLNLDMISRSVKEDRQQRQLSIGTRTPDEYLRELSKKLNSTLEKPFELDLWDVTGHHGSDYASFYPHNVPVMTFNTGLHDDYHTPRDVSSNADFNKMLDVIMLVNEIMLANPEKKN